MKSQRLDRFTVSFYEETYIDKILLEACNRYSSPRNRGNKLKEWAYEYLKSNPELIKEIELSLAKNKVKVEVKDETQPVGTQADKLVKEVKKKGLPGLNIVTSD